MLQGEPETSGYRENLLSPTVATQWMERRGSYDVAYTRMSRDVGPLSVRRRSADVAMDRKRQLADEREKFLGYLPWTQD